MSQVEAARRLRMSRATIYRMLQNGRPNSNPQRREDQGIAQSDSGARNEVFLRHHDPQLLRTMRVRRAQEGQILGNFVPIIAVSIVKGPDHVMVKT
jgi:hypothetical protein